MKKHTQNCTLGIDRGSKYIGLAYKNDNQSVVFPIGYLMNDKSLYFNIADVIVRHRISKIVVGMPSKQEDIQEKIQRFIDNLKMMIDPKITIETIDEDYTSVQSGEITSNSAANTGVGAGFKKNVAEDTVSAMLILERRIAQEALPKP